MHKLTSIFVLCLSTIAADNTHADLVLVKDGAPKATIVIAAQSNDKVKVAAEDLQKYIENISGAKLPIVTDEKEPQGALILVGRSRPTDAMKVAIPSCLTTERVEEGFVIVSKGDRLVLAGNNDGPYHGTEYAVYEFLNRLGVRWFMPGEFGEYVPQQSTIQFPEMNVAEKPDFIMRNWWYVYFNGTPEMMEQTKRWKLRNKMNDTTNATGLDDGFFMIPDDGNILQWPAERFKEHPELFGLNADGTRNENLPNLSNPKSVEITAEIIKDHFRKNPKANSYKIGAGDGFHRDFSAETVKKSLNIAGSYSRQNVAAELNVSEEWIQFVNQVAAEVHKEFPRAYIATSAYANRDIPPVGVKLDDHLVVMAATIACCNLHAMDHPHCWQNQRRGQMLKRWTELCPRVWIYHYNEQMLVTGLTPLPETRKLRRDFPRYKQWGIIGFHDEARNVWAECGIASRYLRARLQWNANADVDAILDDFYAKWYGKAAKPMRTFYDAIEDAIEKAPVHGHEDRILPLVYTPALMKTLERQIASAEKSADSERARLHVRADRLIYQHLQDYMALSAAEEAGDWADAVRHADHTMEVRKQAHAINPFFFWPDSDGKLYWGATYRSAFYQELADKTSGKTGDLMALLPQKAMVRADRHDDGWFEEWYQPDLNEKGWESILTTRPFYAQGHMDDKGHPYDGLIWYRFSVDVPASVKGRKVMVYAPVLECEAWGWCNGQFVGHRPFAEAYIRPNPMEFDVTDAIKPGQRNQFTFRVSTGFMRAADGAGFQSRLMLYSPKQPTIAENKN